MKNKEKILKVLKDFGRLPTYKVAAIAGIAHSTVLEILTQMWTDGEIIGHKFPSGTYWELKKDE